MLGGSEPPFDYDLLARNDQQAIPTQPQPDLAIWSPLFRIATGEIAFEPPREVRTSSGLGKVSRHPLCRACVLVFESLSGSRLRHSSLANLTGMYPPRPALHSFACRLRLHFVHGSTPRASHPRRSPHRSRPPPRPRSFFPTLRRTCPGASSYQDL